jgi:large subunit ribosomal protein L25
MHPWKAAVLHIDFQRIAKDKKIHMKVPLHFINADVSPGVKTSGGTINHVLSELDIVCLPDALPNYIEVNLADLQMGHSIHLSELVLPSGVESSQLRGGDDAVVANIAVPRAEPEPEVEAAAVVDAAAAATAAAAVPAVDEKDKDKDKDKDKKSDKK